MILIIIIVCLFVYTKGKISFSKIVIMLGLGIVVSSAFSKIVQKFGTNTGDIYNLQIYQYLFGLISVILAIYFIDKTHFSINHLKQGFKPGIALGTLSFFGGYFILIALSKGPFPLITAIHSLYMVVAAILGWLIFKEKLTKKKIILIVLAIVAIFLVRMG
jgi:drug/metabolite transporter (DMT)-like permease